jgi:cytochrome c-type biogenesis protein CcmH
MTTLVLASLLLVAIIVAMLAPALWQGSRRTLAVLALAFTIGTLGLYGLVGMPAALDPANVKQPETLDEAIAMVERQLEREPGSVEGWVLLARSRMQQQRWVEARDAFARAHALLPDEPDLMVEYADAQIRAAPDRRFPDAATALLERVVAADPRHPRGLFYLGAQRFQAGRPADAVLYWDRLLPMLDEATAAALAPQLAQARELAGLPAADAPPDEAASTDGTPVAGGPRLRITIELADDLAATLSASDMLFVFARTVDGGGLPVAVKRLRATRFPITVELSDSDGLMPAQKLSMQSQVRLMARISRSGDAAAASGDLEAEAQLLDVVDGASSTLRIDRVRP